DAMALSCGFASSLSVGRRRMTAGSNGAISPLLQAVTRRISLTKSYRAVALLAQTMSGTALLEATDEAIVVGSPAGRIIIPWVTVETITVSERLPGDWLRIQLRDGMRPDGSLLARIWSTSLWQKRTISIPLVTTLRRAHVLADDLQRLR